MRKSTGTSSGEGHHPRALLDDLTQLFATRSCLVGDALPPNEHEHVIPAGHRVMARPILSGLPHEYGLEPLAA
jgi:hypothetical protein